MNSLQNLLKTNLEREYKEFCKLYNVELYNELKILKKKLIKINDITKIKLINERVEKISKILH